MPRYSEREAREAVVVSRSYSEVLRRLGMRPAGGNHALLRKYLDEVWRIPTDHFDGGERRIPPVERVPLEDVLVRNSTYSRSNLKQRLYEESLKERRCEMCGQDENWRGKTMSLILDHINGVPDDNRLENLRIVCPNCAATLDTHCGRKNRREPDVRRCRHCRREFQAKYPSHHYCSRACGLRWDRSGIRGRSNLAIRHAKRPPYEQLVAEIEATNYCAVGRKYGVSATSIRNWVKFYERERERQAVDVSA